MEIIYKNLKDIKPYENNPRNNEDAIEPVMKSIKDFGFKVPMVITKDNVIVTGHTRYEASKRLGLKEVPCIIADDLTEEQIKAFRIVDNKTSEYATWDLELLNLELDNLDYDFGDMDFEDLEEIEPSDNKFESKEDDFNIEDLEEIEPKSKRGDIWKLGNHRVMCGDSTSKEDISKLLGGGNH